MTHTSASALGFARRHRLSAVPGDRGRHDLAQLGTYLQFPAARIVLQWYQKMLTRSGMAQRLLGHRQGRRAASLLATLVGVPASFALVRYGIPAKALLNALILSALVTPPIVSAIGVSSCTCRSAW